MDFDLYGDDSKGKIKLDPRTKLLIFFVSGIVSINSYNDYTMLLYCFLLCIILALCGKFWTSVKGFLSFSVLILIRYCVNSNPSTSHSVNIIVSALSTALLFSFPMIFSLILLIGTTNISHFLASFNKMHVTMKIVIPLAVLFRFIPTVQEEWRGITKAMSFRGIKLDFLSILRSPLKTLEYLLIPLLFSSINVMDEMASAAVARGMDDKIKRTSYEEVKMSSVDYIVCAVFTLGLVLLFVLNNMGVKK